MTEYQNFILNILESFMILYLAKRIFKKNGLLIRMLIGSLFVSIVSITLEFLGGIVSSDMVIKLMLITLLLIVLIVIYKESIIDSMYILIFSSVVVSLVELIVLLMMNVFVKQEVNDFIYGLVDVMISLVIVVYISYVVDLEIIYNFIKKRNATFTFLFLNMFLSMACVVWYWNSNITGFLENSMAFFILVILLVYLNLVVIKDGLINKFSARELVIYKTYEPVIDELIDDIRAKQHEYDNHIQSISTMINHLELKATEERISDYVKDLKVKSGLGSLIKFQNKILLGLIYTKQKKAEDLCIEFDLILRSYSVQSKLKEYELVEVIGTLIDNAFETGVENNHVILTIDRDKDTNIIKVMNRHPYLKQDIINKMFKKRLLYKKRRYPRVWSI